MQFNSQGYIQKLVTHHQEHYIRATLSHTDDSCEICYPVTTTVPRNFLNFYRWYCAQYPASDFFGKSLEYFHQIFQIYSQFNLPQFKNTIFRFIFSFRYSSSPGNLTNIIRSISALTVFTSCFFKDPFTLKDSDFHNDCFHKDFEDYSTLFKTFIPQYLLT